MRKFIPSLPVLVAVAGFTGVAILQAGSAPNVLTLSAGVVTFNATGVGSTSVNYYGLTLYNPGTNPVAISGFSITGAQASDFSVTNGSCPLSPSTLPPGQYCYPVISFTPSAVGLRLAAVVVKDVGGAPQSALLTGEGLAATVGVAFTVPDVAFPSTPLGISSQYAPSAFIQVQNTGNAPLNIQSAAVAGADAQDFQLTQNSCGSTTVPAGAFCYISMIFVPTATGLRGAGLQLTDNAPGGVQTLPLSGVGSPGVNMLQLFPTAVALTPTSTAGNAPTTIYVQNTGTETVTMNDFRITGQNASDFSLVQNYCAPSPYTLPPQYQCSLAVQFSPAALGPRLANLEIFDSAPGSPQTIPMEGTGVGSSANLSFGTSPLVFNSSTVGQANYGSVNLENQGPGTAQISLQVQGIDAADFSVISYCASLNPNTSCYVPVIFTPSAPGIRVATLFATDPVSGQSISLFLIGSGAAAGNALSFSTPAFAPTAVGNESQATFSLYNNNPSSVTISQFALAGSAKSDFGVLQNGCNPGAVIGEFSYCSVTFSFTPSASGTRVAEINIDYIGGSGPLSVPLAATGVSPSRTLTFGSSELTFEAEPVGVPTEVSTPIANNGSEAVTLSGVSLAGTNAQDYAITGNNCPQAPATLPPFASCNVTLQFTASALGARLARLQVSDNASGSPQSLPLVGFGVSSAPALQVYPNVVNFTPEPLGSSEQTQIPVTAVAGIPVSISGIKVIGPNAGDFTAVNNCPAILTGTCDVYVTFTPSVTGARFADLEVLDNAAGSPQVVPLAGLGISTQPPSSAISLLPIPLTFPQAQGIGYTTSTSMTVNNTGANNVLLTGFQIVGAAAKDFGIQSNNCPLSPAPLQPYQSCYITIEFTPTAAGVRLATFKVIDNAPGSPQSISLVGKGVAAVKTLSVSPASLTFSPIPVGSTEYNGGSVNIANSGTVPVTFKSFGFSGADQADFSIGGNYCGSTLNPGVSCQIYFNFTPSATGNRTAEFAIESDATPAKQTVSLTGTGE